MLRTAPLVHVQSSIPPTLHICTFTTTIQPWLSTTKADLNVKTLFRAVPRPLKQTSWVSSRVRLTTLNSKAWKILHTFLQHFTHNYTLLKGIVLWRMKCDRRTCSTTPWGALSTEKQTRSPQIPNPSEDEIVIPVTYDGGLNELTDEKFIQRLNGINNIESICQ